MKKIYKFFILLCKKSIENEIIYFANALTYKLMLAVFPFVIFLISLLGFFNLKAEFAYLQYEIPNEITDLFNTFMQEVIYSKNTTILSYSFLLSIYSASSGFKHMIKGLNKVFDIDDNRNFVETRIISILLMLIFAFVIIFYLLVNIFGDKIRLFLINLNSWDYLFETISVTAGYLFNIVFVFCIIYLIYKISIVKKLKFIQLFPGILFTMTGWNLASKLFNIYVNNFSRYSKIYGSIGSVFLLLLWLNIISFLLLLGGQINALLYYSKEEVLQQS